MRLRLRESEGLLYIASVSSSRGEATTFKLGGCVLVENRTEERVVGIEYEREIGVLPVDRGECIVSFGVEEMSVSWVMLGKGCVVFQNGGVVLEFELRERVEDGLEVADLYYFNRGIMSCFEDGRGLVSLRAYRDGSVEVGLVGVDMLSESAWRFENAIVLSAVERSEEGLASWRVRLVPCNEAGHVEIEVDGERGFVLGWGGVEGGVRHCINAYGYRAHYVLGGDWGYTLTEEEYLEIEESFVDACRRRDELKLEDVSKTVYIEKATSRLFDKYGMEEIERMDTEVYQSLLRSQIERESLIPLTELELEEGELERQDSLKSCEKQIKELRAVMSKWSH
jgi:uncharacterized protein YuzE